MDYLLTKDFSVETFDDKKLIENKRVPEFKASKNDDQFLIELYSPRELFSFKDTIDEIIYQLLHEELGLETGFNVDLKLKPTNNNFNSKFRYPDEIYEQFKKMKVEKAL